MSHLLFHNLSINITNSGAFQIKPRNYNTGGRYPNPPAIYSIPQLPKIYSTFVNAYVNTLFKQNLFIGFFSFSLNIFAVCK